MEVVDSWKPERCSRINTRVHGGGFLETNAVQNDSPCKRTFQQRFPWIRTSNKHFPRIVVDYISGRAEKNDSLTCVEAGSNTSTVTLRVVGGDEKGRLKSEIVKYGSEYQGTRTRERLRWQGPAACIKRQTRPLVREGAPHETRP
jgi:hypothetical protein